VLASTGTLQLQTATSDLSAWNTAMLQASYTDGHVMLPDSVAWPTLHSPVLFVRDFYKPFFDDVLNGLRRNSSSISEKGVAIAKVVVCGNPGIGKSAFGMYAVFRALKDGRTVVYASAKLLPKNLLFKDGVVYSVKDLDDLALVLSDFNTVLICDSLTPPVCNAFTMMVTSPRKERWHEYDKEMDCQMFFFPVFSMAEMRACRDSCFPWVDDASLESRFSRWGGIPRYVLAKLSSVNQQKLENAVTAITLDNILDHAESLEMKEEKDMSHRLLHIKVAGELDDSLHPNTADFYSKVRSELASKYVANLVYSTAVRTKHMRILDFLYGSSGSSTFAVLRGQLFEEEALARLSAGGQFEVRRLAANSAGSLDVLDIAPSARTLFRTLDGMDDDSLRSLISTRLGCEATPVLFEPESKSLCAIDAVLPGRLLANATVSTKHKAIVLAGVQRPGLIRVAELLQLEDEIPFYWLVPSDVFDNLKVARPFSLSGKALSAAGHPVARRVVQYALHVSLQQQSPVAAFKPRAHHSGSRAWLLQAAPRLLRLVRK
jgi:hypothetical protein